ncbi:MAG: MFS transporter [Candidatus Methanofastidiosum sp.]|nr:MFS transporter [Methanofastidiosum sp.]
MNSHDQNIGLKYILRDGVASQIMITLTSGTFLTAFALSLGASNLLIGIMASIPAIANLIQIPAVYIVERYRDRRKISMFSSAISRSFILLIALLPCLVNYKLGIIFFILFLILQSAFSAISGCSWNSWMRDLIPIHMLGSFFSRRMRFATLSSIPMALLAGYFIDYWSSSYPNLMVFSYSIIFFFGYLSGLIGVYYISKIPEPGMLLKAESNILRLFSQPMKDINYRNLLKFLGSWNFAVNLAAPFFTVYMLKRLDLSMSSIVLLMILGQLMTFIFLHFWGRISDKFSNKSVLQICGPLFILSILGWTFTTLPEKYILTIPLLIIIHATMGISAAGVSLASGNITLKLAPEGNSTAYLAFSSIINSITAGIAPIIGGIFADFFEKRELALTLEWISPENKLLFETFNLKSWDFFFFLAFLIGLYSLHRLANIHEGEEIQRKIIFNELFLEARHGVRGFSNIGGGLRYMIQFPFSTLLLVKKPDFLRRRLMRRIRSKNIYRYKKQSKN